MMNKLIKWKGELLQKDEMLFIKIDNSRPDTLVLLDKDNTVVMHIPYSILDKNDYLLDDTGEYFGFLVGARIPIQLLSSHIFSGDELTEHFISTGADGLLYSTDQLNKYFNIKKI